MLISVLLISVLLISYTPVETFLKSCARVLDYIQRLFNNEFMTAVYTGSTQYVTALTLALLEDSGWYHPNYKVAQNSPFALGAGCDFVEDQCIQNGSVPRWAQGTFCSDPQSIGCTPDKHLVAYCDISEWDGNLPSGYQYFDDPVSTRESIFFCRLLFLGLIYSIFVPFQPVCWWRTPANGLLPCIYYHIPL